MAASGCESSDYRLAWSVRAGRVGEFVTHADQVLTIGSRVAAYDAATGRARGATALSADLGNITRGQLGPGAMVSGDSLIFGWYDFNTETGTVFCFDAKSLEQRWRWQIHWPWTQRSLRPTISVIADEQHVYAAASGKDRENLFAFRLADGRLIWSRSVEKYPAEAALALHRERLLVRSQLWAWTRDWHEQIDAIRVEDGQRLWRTWLTGEAKYHVGRPLIHDDHLYVTTRGGVDAGNLFVVRLSDGHTTRVEIPASGAPFARRGNVVYIGGWPALAYDVVRQQPVWRTRLGYPDEALVPMIAGGTLDPDRNRVFVGDSQQFVYALAADTGVVQDRIRVDRYPRFEFFSPLKAMYGSYGVRRLEMHRGMLFVGTVDSSLFVFRSHR